MINKDIKLTFLHWFPGGLHQQSCTLYSLGWIWRSVNAQITKKKQKKIYHIRNTLVVFKYMVQLRQTPVLKSCKNIINLENWRCHWFSSLWYGLSERVWLDFYYPIMNCYKKWIKFYKLFHWFFKSAAFSFTNIHIII